jgi:choline dehydrogenase-like flavoprotein
MLPEGSARFAIDNQLVGVGVFDHVITLVAWRYDGPVAYEGYDYRDDVAHRADIARWLASGSGPYAQYQPVSILNYAQAGATPDTEIFVNPNGVGAMGSAYDGPRNFAAYAMLLDPSARDLIRLDEHGNVRKPAIYLPQDDASGVADTELMTSAVYDMIQLFETDPHLSIAFGPGSASHPHLDPHDREDVRRYVTSDAPVDGVYFGRLNANHFGGTARLSEGAGGVDPTSLVLRGTRNVAVVDASLIPTPVAAHPVGTIMAIADRVGDVLAARWD